MKKTTPQRAREIAETHAYAGMSSCHDLRSLADQIELLTSELDSSKVVEAGLNKKIEILEAELNSWRNSAGKIRVKGKSKSKKVKLKY